MERDFEKKLAETYKGLYDLGFTRRKNYRKRKPGVSSKSLFIDNIEVFTLEKHHDEEFGYGQYFIPTFRHDRFFMPITSLSEANKLLEALYLIKPEQRPVINMTII